MNRTEPHQSCSRPGAKTPSLAQRTTINNGPNSPSPTHSAPKLTSTLMATTDDPARSCTVFFGWSSFVGRAIATALLRSGRWAVRVADPDPAPLDCAAHVVASVTDRAQVQAAVAGASAVFYVDPTLPSTPAGAKGFHDLYKLVVGGAGNVVAACREAGVERLIYTGSADVVLDGVQGIDGGDESMPYPEKFVDILNELRAQAEKLVLFANGKDGLSTCTLRPSNPFGPGDPYLVPFLIGEARSGRAKFIIGNGENTSDFTYVENVAHANICAEQALCSTKASVSGKPFFITNHEPVKVWEFISNILEGLGYERPKIYLPVKLVLPAVTLLQQLCERLSLCSTFNPRLTPAIVHSLSRTRTFDSSKAQNLIGYSPIVSLEDGVTRTVESFSQLANDTFDGRQRDYIGPSKADELLGSGRVADILLWRDEKKTFACVTAFFLLYYWFLLSGRTFISSTAKLLLLVSVILFVHAILPSSMFGFNIKKISSSYFEVSELSVRHLVISGASIWNYGVSTLKLLAQEYDWNAFFKVAGLLYVMKWLLSYPLSVLVGFGIVFLFTIFIVFDQYEDEILKLMTVAAAGIEKLKEKLISKLPSILVTHIYES